MGNFEYKMNSRCHKTAIY